MVFPTSRARQQRKCLRLFLATVGSVKTMSYSYQKERAALFTEEGQRMFLSIRDRANELLAEAGAFQAQEAWSGVTGSSWQMLACLDRMVELGEITEVVRDCMAQHRIFVRE